MNTLNLEDIGKHLLYLKNKVVLSLLNSKEADIKGIIGLRSGFLCGLKELNVNGIEYTENFWPVINRNIVLRLRDELFANRGTNMEIFKSMEEAIDS